MATSCFACGHALTGQDPRDLQCSNRNCPEGGSFFYCGYCREAAFARSHDRRYCVNQTCPSYHLQRESCPACKKVSIMTLKNVTVCVNRDCPDNTSIISLCFFCRERAFFLREDLMFCTKGRCSYVFKHAEECFFCKKQSHLVDMQSCQNPECSQREMCVAACPECGQRSLSEDSSGNKRCLNTACGFDSSKHISALPEEAPSLMSDSNFEGTLMLPAGSFSGSQKKPAIPPRAPTPPPPTPPPTPRPPQRLNPFGRAEPPRNLNAARPKPEEEPLRVPGPNDPTSLAEPIVPAVLPPKPLGPSKGVPGFPPAPDAKPAGRVPAQEAFRSSPAVPSSGIEQVWDHLKSVFVSPQKERSPIYMVIGLPGSGKTTFLTMIGEILHWKNDKYCFPYDGVEARWTYLSDRVGDGNVQALLKKRSKDLVWGFAQDQYTKRLAHMHWPTPTVPEEGDQDDPATFFLLTEILRNQKSAGHVLTLETAGEEYEEVVRNFTQYMTGATPKNAVHRVLLEMIGLAEGIIILVDPESPHNDVAYNSFFMVLEEVIRPRALNIFYREVEKLVTRSGGGPPGKGPGDNLIHVLSHMRKEDDARKQWETQRERERGVARERLLAIQRKIAEGDEKTLEGPEGEWLQSLEKPLLERVLIGELQPHAARVRQAKDKALRSDPAMRRQNILKYYTGYIGYCLEHIEDLLVQRPGEHSKAPTASALWELKSRFELSPQFQVDLDVNAFQERPVRHCRFLKNISIVVTKSDRCSIIYPPESFPRVKLPGCWIHLRQLEDYLKICGGAVRYYNASATGHTMLCSGAYQPGRPSNHSPINVIEPLFDMLGL